ncbi:hypothetical protein TNCV_870681 [Trichonephila clavipes]|nr:hypothetical protein TNCV_870681 [Trichonephila clavipes]
MPHSPCPLAAAVAEWYRHRIVAGFVASSSPVPLKTRRLIESELIQFTIGTEQPEREDDDEEPGDGLISPKSEPLPHKVVLTQLPLFGPVNRFLGARLRENNSVTAPGCWRRQTH